MEKPLFLVPRRYFPVKTAFPECVTGGTHLADFDQQRIAVTVIGHAFNELKMTRGHPLGPEFLSGPGPEAGLAGLERCF